MIIAVGNNNFRAEEPLLAPLTCAAIDEIMAIENACYSTPWSRENFLHEFTNPAAAVYGCRSGRKLAGYICYWLIAGEMQILNVAVAPEFRRLGFAEKLLSFSLQSCREQKAATAWLEVRAGNRAAIELYRKQGFRDNGTRRAYYRDGEDALLMLKRFETPPFQESCS